MNQEQVVADLCPTCLGKGLDSTGKVCTYCRGIGLIGKDGTNEYYLEPDGKGGLKVSGIKGQAQQKTTPGPQQKTPSPQRSGILKSLLFIGLIISYSAFIGGYILFIDDSRIFWLVTLIAVGFFFIFLLYDARFSNALIKFVTKTFLKEPNDFLTELQKRKKEVGIL